MKQQLTLRPRGVLKSDLEQGIFEMQTSRNLTTLIEQSGKNSYSFARLYSFEQ